MTELDISLVALTWNSEAHVGRFLASAMADVEASGLNAEVIVVDNGSKDDTVSIIEQFQEDHSSIHLIRLERNFGTTVPRNLGIRRSRGEHILIIDSDTEFSIGTLRSLLTSFESIPVAKENIGIIHPRMIFPDGRFQENARRYPTLFSKVFRILSLEKLRSRDESIQAVIEGRITPVDYAASAAWLVPRRVFDEVGLFDESIFYSPEDLEFCIRCWKKGFMVWYYPIVTVVHHSQKITAKRPFSRLGLSHFQGLLRLWLKYHFLFSRNGMESRLMSREFGTTAKGDSLQGVARVHQ